ncbi:hypothetical protein JCM3775_005416 [Rhodotorula graminis]
MRAKQPAETVLKHLGGDVWDTSKLSAKPWIVLMVRMAMCEYGTHGEIDCDPAPLALELFQHYHRGEGRDEPGGIYEAARVSYQVTCVYDWLAHVGGIGAHDPREPWFSLLAHKVLLFGHLGRLSAASLDALEVRTFYEGARKRFDDWNNVHEQP